MKGYLGIDLGSTTTKAVIISEQEKVLGKGITNSRSNYTLACQIAREEAETDTRFNLMKQRLSENREIAPQHIDELTRGMAASFKLKQHLESLELLRDQCHQVIEDSDTIKDKAAYRQVIDAIYPEMVNASLPLFEPHSGRGSNFFRDLATDQFMHLADTMTVGTKLSLDRLTAVFDRAIREVECTTFGDRFNEYMQYAVEKVSTMPQFSAYRQLIDTVIEETLRIDWTIENTIGTGYGRQRLPFGKNQIRSEILCHGLGAHFMYPGTRTVLDIGGQDTKGIQVDHRGIVTNFQMNDRCAAGCGRYLGYIANEMDIGVHSLGPIALKAGKTLKINSTCTVFAGAELRERLSLGEKREDILAGIHRAIILRAMSLLARSGGVRNEFTFTGGVALNEAATKVLKEVIRENYGEITINIDPESIYMGALGAALFAGRDTQGAFADVDLKALKKRKVMKT